MARETQKEAARKARICGEKERLWELFDMIPLDRKKLAEKLIDRASFMLVTLEGYEELIVKEGAIVKMTQGTYEIDRENPAARGYNVMIKNYQLVIKSLVELLPDKNGGSVSEELEKFLAEGKM